MEPSYRENYKLTLEITWDQMGNINKEYIEKLIKKELNLRLDKEYKFPSDMASFSIQNIDLKENR